MRQYLVFSMAGDDFGIEIGKVVEVLRATRAKPVPELPDYMPGVITVRGEMVPMVDMRKRFGIDPFPAKERSLIVRIEGDKVGLVVDGVKGITGFGEDAIKKPKVIFRGIKAKYLSGLGNTGEGIVMLLDMENILSSEEKIVLRKARARIKGRQ